MLEALKLTFDVCVGRDGKEGAGFEGWTVFSVAVSERLCIHWSTATESSVNVFSSVVSLFMSWIASARDMLGLPGCIILWRSFTLRTVSFGNLWSLKYTKISPTVRPLSTTAFISPTALSQWACVDWALAKSGLLRAHICKSGAVSDSRKF